MIPYTPPLDDIRFVLTRLIGLDRLAALPNYEAVSEDLVEAVLDETAKIASEVFAPLNQIGDKQGARWTDGTVTMPPGFADAYHAYVEGGWNGLSVEADLGGQGLPSTLGMPVQEMLQAANLGLALCTLLNQGAVDLLATHGDAALQAKFLPKMVTGEWTGVMCLTEPQAGSDVGAVQCRAVREDDHYRITGQKIFISYGDHDMADNIIHLVLARLPDAPEGTKGLSLFLVPKILVQEDGALGTANDVRTVSIEHKLGQHASPTCVMAYGDAGGAIGYLVGAEQGGIAAMFTMMNNARIGVGVQGLGLMERAYQQACDYAKTRIQGRSLQRTHGTEPVAIIRHPDVRRMLLSMRASIEAARALAYSCASNIDVAKRGTDKDVQSRAQGQVDLLTPIVKAWLTDLSNEVTSTAIQVVGGMGYIEETGIAQHMRDARVLAIYEGANGIQANDLVFRKIARDDGAALHALLDEMDAFLPTLRKQANDDFTVMHERFALALTAARATGDWIGRMAKTDPAIAAASASPFLRLLGTVTGGYYLLQSALLAHRDLATRSGDADFRTHKIMTARFFAEHMLPQCESLAVTVVAGSTVTLAVPEGYF